MTVSTIAFFLFTLFHFSASNDTFLPFTRISISISTSSTTRISTSSCCKRSVVHCRTTSTASTEAEAAFAFPRNPIEIIDRDFKALTRKVTAHHILLPKSTQAAISLKQKIRNKVNPAKDSGRDPIYVVDAFSSAAAKFSRDEETALNGGLLGTLVPQGYCRAQELDKACFEVPLGEISGPIESEYGYHLVLVTERTNCPKLDGGYNKITRGGERGADTVFLGDSSKEGSDPIVRLALQQVGFWIAVSFAGGILAEVVAKAANVVDKLPWQ